MLFDGPDVDLFTESEAQAQRRKEADCYLSRRNGLVDFLRHSSILTELPNSGRSQFSFQDVVVTIAENLTQQGRIWLSSALLSHYIANHKEVVQNKTVVELGCGCGLPGIVASKCGAKSVYLTDFESARDLVNQNIQLNQPLSTPIQFQPLVWGNSIDHLQIPVNEPVVVLCSDVVYWESNGSDLRDLCDTIDRINPIVVLSVYEARSGRSTQLILKSECQVVHVNVFDYDFNF